MTWTRTAAGIGAAAILALLLATTTVVPGAAASEQHMDEITTSSGTATFEGRYIDLKRGWGDARACVVWQRDGETECFRTDQQADAAMTQGLPAGEPVSGADAAAEGPTSQTAASSCSHWFTIYEHVGYGGRSLRFRDRGYTQDLANWGFAYQTSSYRVGSCSVTMRDASGAVYPGWTGAWASSSSMASGWNDRVRYIRVN